MVLGTGTNASFLIEKDGKNYIFNTEWASFNPNNITLLIEERFKLDQLPNSHNYIDVLCGVKYKVDLLNIIIREQKLNLQSITQEELISCFNNGTVHDERIQLFMNICARSRQILAALMSSLIKVLNISKVHIILDGAVYQNPIEKKLFQNLIEKNLKEINCGNIQIVMCCNDKSAFMGSAYYALCDLLN